MTSKNYKFPNNLKNSNKNLPISNDSSSISIKEENVDKLSIKESKDLKISSEENSESVIVFKGEDGGDDFLYRSPKKATKNQVIFIPNPERDLPLFLNGKLKQKDLTLENYLLREGNNNYANYDTHQFKNSNHQSYQNSEYEKSEESEIFDMIEKKVNFCLKKKIDEEKKDNYKTKTNISSLINGSLNLSKINYQSYGNKKSPSRIEFTSRESISQNLNTVQRKIKPKLISGLNSKYKK